MCSSTAVKASYAHSKLLQDHLQVAGNMPGPEARRSSNLSPGSLLVPLSDLLRLLRRSSSLRPASSGCAQLLPPCLPTYCPPLLLPCLPTDCPDAPEEALGGRALGLNGSGALPGRSSLQQHTQLNAATTHAISTMAVPSLDNCTEQAPLRVL